MTSVQRHITHTMRFRFVASNGKKRQKHTNEWITKHARVANCARKMANVNKIISLFVVVIVVRVVLQAIFNHHLLSVWNKGICNVPYYLEIIDICLTFILCGLCPQRYQFRNVHEHWLFKIKNRQSQRRVEQTMSTHTHSHVCQRSLSLSMFLHIE